jgi:hypothetical protein
MTDATTSAPTREKFRKEIEDTRTAFHELLASLSPADFKKKSGNASWSNGQLMWHTAWGVGFVPQGVDRARKGKDLNLPRGVFNVLNPWITRWGSRGITPESVARSYDEAHAKVIALLETIKDDEWTKGSKITGEFQTVTHHFEIPATHFAEHKTDILKSLGRTG